MAEGERPPLTIDPNDPDLARVAAAYALASQEGMSAEVATQVLALADNSPAEVQEAADRLNQKTTWLRSVAEGQLAEERAAHDDLIAKLNATTQEEAADYSALRGEQEQLLAAARGLNEQIGRISAFFGLTPAATPAPDKPTEESEETGTIGRLFSIFVERKEATAASAASPQSTNVTGDEPPIFNPQDDAVRKIGILAALIALPNRTAEQVLAMVRSQGIDLPAIGQLTTAAGTIASRQIAQSEGILKLVEARHQEEVSQIGAATNKVNTDFDTVVKEHAAALTQIDTLDQQISFLRQFFNFPPTQR